MIDHHEALVEARREIERLKTERDIYFNELRRLNDLRYEVRRLGKQWAQRAANLAKWEWSRSTLKNCAAEIETLLGAE